MTALTTAASKLPSLDKIPSPLFALVGVTDVAAQKAKELNTRLGAIELPTTDRARVAFGKASHSVRSLERPTVDLNQLRDELPTMDQMKIDISKIELARMDPRQVDLSKVELPKVELPKVELSDAAAYAFEMAAAVERTYDELVVRGERRVAELRGEEHLTAPVPAAHSTATKPVKKTAKKTTAKATKPVEKTAKKATVKATKPVKRATAETATDTTGTGA